MKLANIFPKSGLAPVLAAGLSFVTLFGGASNANAEPARATTVSTTVPNTVSVPPAHSREAPSSVEKPDKMVDAALFSTKGVSFIIVLGKNDTVQPYYKDLASVMRLTKMEGVPARLFDMRSLTEEKTTGYMIIDGMIFRKPPDEKINYSSDEFRDMGGDAVTLFRQSQRYKAEQQQKAAVGSPEVIIR